MRTRLLPEHPELIFRKKPPTLILGFPVIPTEPASESFYATYTYPAWHTAVSRRPDLALALKTAFRQASGRYQRGEGKFQLLFSVDHQPVGIPGPIVAAVVVVSQVSFAVDLDRTWESPVLSGWQIDWGTTC